MSLLRFEKKGTKQAWYKEQNNIQSQNINNTFNASTTITKQSQLNNAKSASPKSHAIGVIIGCTPKLTSILASQTKI